MWQLFLIVLIFIVIAVLALSVGVLIKGKFPETHVGHNPDMKKIGITCAKNDDKVCQGRLNEKDCDRCSGRKAIV
jgi:hypothetical protein